MTRQMLHNTFSDPHEKFLSKKTGNKRDFWENTEGVRACGRVLGLLLIRFLHADIFVFNKKAAGGADLKGC